MEKWVVTLDIQGERSQKFFNNAYDAWIFAEWADATQRVDACHVRRLKLDDLLPEGSSTDEDS